MNDDPSASILTLDGLTLIKASRAHEITSGRTCANNIDLKQGTIALKFAIIRVNKLFIVGLFFSKSESDQEP
jgi:hypothetical protein